MAVVAPFGDPRAVGAHRDRPHGIEGTVLHTGRAERATGRNVPRRDVGVSATGDECLSAHGKRNRVHPIRRRQPARRASGVAQHDPGPRAVLDAVGEVAVRGERDAEHGAAGFDGCYLRGREVEENRATVRRDGQPRSLRVVRQVAHDAIHWQTRLDQARMDRIRDIPERDVVIATAHHDVCSVGTQRNRVDRRVATGLRVDARHVVRMPRAGHVPQIDGPVAARRHQHSPPGNSPRRQIANDCVLKRPERPAHLATMAVREPDRRVRAPGRDDVVGDKRRREHATSVTAGDGR